ncbi:Hypothetical predicted protein [Olea europaea subsp. europaea]|uniref:Uncharacterized protein n=1 Tax=Olea europaea subsp. europaea TaxID=158383 RepID=A0A8S0V4D0_OLEEU|nr:Hypothetical predicted protein [Olea europaea subsp. europaea]
MISTKCAIPIRMFYSEVLDKTRKRAPEGVGRKWYEEEVSFIGVLSVKGAFEKGIVKERCNWILESKWFSWGVNENFEVSWHVLVVLEKGWERGVVTVRRQCRRGGGGGKQG